MNWDDMPLSMFEVDCDGTACGSGKSVGLHDHPRQDGGVAVGRVVFRDGRRVRYGVG